jgi:acetyl-CoA C-acetyltransferase
MSRVFIIAATRTAVVPRHGAFARCETFELAAPCFRALISQSGLSPSDIDMVIMGNALYGGGNPARMAALCADWPESIPALTIDTQCCAGLDAVILAASRIRAGDADVIVAGGVESYSRSPLRFSRPKFPYDTPVEYLRPPFTPWAERDPDMLKAAAALAHHSHVTRVQQDAYAAQSHDKACAAHFSTDEIVILDHIQRDAFSRPLNPSLCSRLQPIAGEGDHALTAATIAVEADAAAVLLLVSERQLIRMGWDGFHCEVVAGVQVGCDPTQPALAPITAIHKLLAKTGVALNDIHLIELMEAFAVQALVCIEALGLDINRINRKGGALARGHPIGASGAILMVRLWHDLIERGSGQGLASIPAAGGLGSAIIMRSA